MSWLKCTGEHILQYKRTSLLNEFATIVAKDDGQYVDKI